MLISVCIFVLSLFSVQCFPTGAGSCISPAGCPSMFESPDNGVRLSFNNGTNTYVPGMTYNVTLTTSVSQLAGFLLYAQDSTGFRQGTWTLIPNTQYKTGCNGVTGSSITHTINTVWSTSLTLMWTAPSTAVALTMQGVGVRHSFVWSLLTPISLTPQSTPPPTSSVSIKFSKLPSSYTMGTTYTLSTKVTNTGNTVLQNFQVSFSATGVNLVSVTGATCSGTATSMKCTVASLAVGSAITLKPKINAAASGKLTASAVDSTGKSLGTKSITITV